MKIASSLAAAAVLASLSAPAYAAQITGTGLPTSDPALAGGTVVDFESTVNNTAAIRTFGNLTITGLTNADNTYASQYNTFGRYLDNAQGLTPVLVFTFANAVSAFGFNLGAADAGNWTLSAGGQTYSFAPTVDGNAKNFYGISGNNITSATLSFVPGDWVLFDNVTYVTQAQTAAVPEPATWAMMLLGFGSVGYMMRRRQQATARIRFA